jgi:sterol 14-demethylase
MDAQVSNHAQRSPAPPPARSASRRAPPAVSGALPLVGHAVEFVRDCLGLMWRAYQEHGEVAKLRVFNKDIVLMTGPRAAEAMFRAPDEQLSPNEAYKMMVPVFGKDIVYDAAPERMTEQLGMLRPALQDKRMRTYGEIVADETRRMLRNFGERGEFDLVQFCAELTNFTSTRCLIGREFREQMSDEFAKVYYDLERGITPAGYIHPHIPLPSTIRRDRARVRLVQMIGSIVDQRRKSGSEGEDFLQTLMDAQYKDGSKLSDHEITGMLLAAMFAGHHTSSVTTAWTLLELLQAPDYLERLLAELADVYKPGDDVTFQSLRQITLTENAVKEALRLRPPLYILLRAGLTDFEYGEFAFPKGTWFATSPWVSHRLPGEFVEPLRFDPDRFAPGREEDKKQFTFISFGAGRHKCMGNAFALLQVKAILAILLRRYDFEIVRTPVQSDFHGLVVGPREPCRVRYRRRAEAKVAPRAGAEPRAHTNGAPAAGRRYRVVLDLDLCQGHAACVGEAPEVFRVRDLGKVELVDEQPSPALRDKVEAAARYCPTHTIRIVEDEAPEATAAAG